MKFPLLRIPPFVLPALGIALAPMMLSSAYASEAIDKPAVAGRTVTIDRDTNRLRAPEANEMPSAEQATAARSAATQSMRNTPEGLRFRSQRMFGQGGAIGQRLDFDRALRFSVAHQHADGSLHKDCVVGEDGVPAHLTATLKQRSNHE